MFRYLNWKAKILRKIFQCMHHLMPWLYESVSVRICASPPGHSYHSIMINHGLQGNSNSFVRPKRTLTEDKILYNQPRNRLTKEIRVAKKNYSEKLSSQQTTRHQYELVWRTSPCVRHHPHSLWRINNWLTISMCFTVDLKRPDSHPTPALICTSHIHLPPPAVRTAERIISASLPNLQDLYISRVRKRAKKVTLDPSHPALSELLPSVRRYRSLSTRTARHKNSFPPGHIPPEQHITHPGTVHL